MTIARLGQGLLAVALGLGLWTAAPGAKAASNPADAVSTAADSAHQVLVLLRLPPDHFHPGSEYADSYGDGAGAAARRRVAQRIAADHGLKLVTSWPIPLIGVDCFVMTVPEGQSPDTVVANLAHDPNVASAEPMGVFRGQASTEPSAGDPALAGRRESAKDAGQGEATHNDPLYRAQPAAREWRLADLHAVATGRNIRVAVIDSMVDASQPDLAGQIQTSQDFVLGHAATAEQHGTGVAGIIASVADNHIGIAGVAPHARIMALRACWQEGSEGAVCDTLSLAKALYFAIDHNPQVINLSLSGPADPLLGRLIDVALARGMVVVGAADPHAPDGGFPASHPGVVAVSDDPLTTLPGVFIAPGRDTPTTQPGGRFAFVSGSSYAAAHVSGLFALLKERNARATTPVSLVTQRPGGGAIDTCASLSRAAGAACPRSAGAYSTAALDRRAARLVEMGHASVKDGFISIPRRTVAALERQEIERVGKEMAAERGLTYSPSGLGEYVSGRLAGVANLASGRFAMIEDGLGFQLVPWQPVLEKRLDQHISGVRRDDGGIEWSFSRNRQIGLGL